MTRNVELPAGYHLEWAGEFASQQRANRRMALVVPITVLAIFLFLYTMSARPNGLCSSWSVSSWHRLAADSRSFLTHTNFSVSSAVGFLALFGVSVEIGVIMLEYINQLRARGHPSKTPPSTAPSCACAPS